MDFKKIAIVSIKTLEIPDFSSEHEEEAESYKPWISKLSRENGVLLSYPHPLCISYAKVFSTYLGLKISVLKNLPSFYENTLSSNSIEDQEIIEVDVPNFDSLKDVEHLINWIQSNYSFGVIVIDEENFQELNIDYQKRIKKYSSFNEIRTQAAGKESIKKKFDEEIQEQFVQAFFNLFEEKSREISEKFSKIQADLGKIPYKIKILCKQIKHSFYKEQNALCKSLLSVAKLVDFVRTEVEKSKKSVNFYKELADLYIPTKVPTGKLQIKRFYFIQEKAL
jgi:hypothetical protein